MFFSARATFAWRTPVFGYEGEAIILLHCKRDQPSSSPRSIGIDCDLIRILSAYYASYMHAYHSLLSFASFRDDSSNLHYGPHQSNGSLTFCRRHPTHDVIRHPMDWSWYTSCTCFLHSVPTFASRTTHNPFS